MHLFKKGKNTFQCQKKIMFSNIFFMAVWSMSIMHSEFSLGGLYGPGFKLWSLPPYRPMGSIGQDVIIFKS